VSTQDPEYGYISASAGITSDFSRLPAFFSVIFEYNRKQQKVKGRGTQKNLSDRHSGYAHPWSVKLVRKIHDCDGEKDDADKTECKMKKVLIKKIHTDHIISQTKTTVSLLWFRFYT